MTTRPSISPTDETSNHEPARRLTRRTVLKGATAGMATLALASAASLAPSLGRRVLAQDLSNTVMFAVEGSPPTFDPATAIDSRVDTPSMDFYNALVQHTPGTTEIEPDLAKSWQPEDDDLSYNFQLRDGVLFHDGAALNSADVAYTVERLLGLQRGVYRNVTAITGVETPDERTVVLTLDAPFPGLIQALTRVSIVNAELVKANERDGDFGEAWLNANDAGSGPYQFVAFEPEQQFTLAKFDDYWRNLIEDERKLGLLDLGFGYQDLKFGGTVDSTSPYHQDIMIASPRVELDGVMLCEKNHLNPDLGFETM